MSSDKVNKVKQGLLEHIGQKIALTNAGTPVFHVTENIAEVKEGEQSIKYIGPEEISIVFREDKAIEILDDKQVEIAGILDTPARWVEARTSIIAGLAANVIVDRDNLMIALTTEERYQYKNQIVGTLTYHPIFKLFDINGNQFITPKKLADKIKMNRSFFETKQEALRLVALLTNFEAKVNKEVEQSSTMGGDKRDLRAQTVTSNLPASFKMKLPIFKGEAAKLFEVEIEVEPGDLTCRLVSPEANEEMEHLRDTAIDKVLERIKAVDPSIVILEV